MLKDMQPKCKSPVAAISKF